MSKPTQAEILFPILDYLTAFQRMGGSPIVTVASSRGLEFEAEEPLAYFLKAALAFGLQIGGPIWIFYLGYRETGSFDISQDLGISFLELGLLVVSGWILIFNSVYCFAFSHFRRTSLQSILADFLAISDFAGPPSAERSKDWRRREIVGGGVRSIFVSLSCITMSVAWIMFCHKAFGGLSWLTKTLTGLSLGVSFFCSLSTPLQVTLITLFVNALVAHVELSLSSTAKIRAISARKKVCGKDLDDVLSTVEILCATAQNSYGILAPVLLLNFSMILSFGMTALYASFAILFTTSKPMILLSSSYGFISVVCFYHLLYCCGLGQSVISANKGLSRALEDLGCHLYGRLSAKTKCRLDAVVDMTQSTGNVSPYKFFVLSNGSFLGTCNYLITYFIVALQFRAA